MTNELLVKRAKKMVAKVFDEKIDGKEMFDRAMELTIEVLESENDKLKVELDEFFEWIMFTETRANMRLSRKAMVDSMEEVIRKYVR